MLMPSFLPQSEIRSPQQSNSNGNEVSHSGYVPMFQYQAAPPRSSVNSRESYAEPASTTSGQLVNHCRKCNGIRDVCHCPILHEGSSYATTVREQNLEQHVHSTQSTGNVAEPTQFFELSSTSTPATSTVVTMSAVASCSSTSSTSGGRHSSTSQFIPNQNRSQRKTEAETVSHAYNSSVEHVEQQQQHQLDRHNSHPEQDNNNNTSNNNHAASSNEHEVVVAPSRLVSNWPAAAMDDHAVDEQLMLQSNNVSAVVYELPSSSQLSSNISSNTSSSFEASNSNNNVMLMATNSNSTAYDDVTSSASDTEHVQFANTRTTNTTTTTSAQKKKHQQNRTRNSSTNAVTAGGDVSASSSSSVIELDATPSTSAQAQQHQQQQQMQMQHQQPQQRPHPYIHGYRHRRSNNYELDSAGGGDNSSDDGWDLRTHNAPPGQPEPLNGSRPPSSIDLDGHHTDHTYYNSRGYVDDLIALHCPPTPLPSDNGYVRSGIGSASCTTATHTTCSVDYGGRDICGVHRLIPERDAGREPPTTPVRDQQQHQHQHQQRPAAVLKSCYALGLGSGIVRTRSRVRSMDEAVPGSSNSSSAHSICQPPRKLARLDRQNNMSPSTMSPTNFYAFQPGRHRHRTYAELARTTDPQVSPQQLKFLK